MIPLVRIKHGVAIAGGAIFLVLALPSFQMACPLHPLHDMSIPPRVPFFLLQEFHMVNTEEGRQSELSVVDSLLSRDLRNNSAWNHRWFVVHSTLGSTGTLSDEV